MAGIVSGGGEWAGVSVLAWLVAATIGLCAIISQKAPPATPARPSIVRKVLPSGLRLIVAPRPDSPLVALDLRVRSGVGEEDTSRNGLTHAVEHLVFKGTARRPQGAIDSAMESLGGELSARTTRDSTQFGATLPAPRWREGMALLAEMMLEPALRAEDWEAEKPVIRSEMALLQSDPLRAGVAALARALWAADEPYGFPLMGEWEKLGKQGVEALRAHWREHYRPDNLTLVVVGAVDPAEVEKAAQALFPGESAATVIRPLRRAVPRSGPPPLASVVRSIAPRERATFLMGWPTPPAADLHSQAVLLVLAELLAPGGSRGRLAAPLCRAPLAADSLVADVLIQRAGGVFILSSVLAPSSVPKAEEAILKQLKRLAEDGFSEEEVAGARDSVRVRLLSEELTVEGLAARLAFWDALDASEASEGLKSRLSLVTPAEVTRAISLFLKDTHRASALVGASATPERGS